MKRFQARKLSHFVKKVKDYIPNLALNTKSKSLNGTSAFEVSLTLWQDVDFKSIPHSKHTLKFCCVFLGKV